MTKEECLNKCHKEHVEKIGTSSINPTNFPGAWSETAQNAMDEWANARMENLITWLNDNDFRSTRWSGNMQSDHINEGKRMHASEIIELFLKSKQQ